jgi:hypothetical protein
MLCCDFSYTDALTAACRCLFYSFTAEHAQDAVFRSINKFRGYEKGEDLNDAAIPSRPGMDDTQ